MKSISASEKILALYVSKRPVSPRATFEMWKSTLEEMIQDGLPYKTAHAWMEVNKELLQLPVPALTTVRDWMTELRVDKVGRRKSSTELKATELTAVMTLVTTAEPRSDTVTLPSIEGQNTAPAEFKDDLSSNPQGHHPGLYQLPIAVLPESDASEGEFEEALMPQYRARYEKMEVLLQYYQSIPAATRSELAQAAFANLDPKDESAYISRYADIYVIMRTARVTVGTWIDALFRGRRAFSESQTDQA